MDISTLTRRADATPHAAALIEGLRDFGYSLETALADIIDNSITAGASRIDILADSAGESPWIAIVDNGSGMSEGELIEAMRPGSKNPLDKRQGSDLGRFGLGMKSASFSQCRALFVVSRKNGETSCAAWDLDEVSKSNSWEVSLFDNPSFPAMDYLQEDGTAVIWQKLDRLDGGTSQSKSDRPKLINAALSQAEEHLRLVFHRFMGGTKPRLKIFLNQRAIVPVDPFLKGNPATQIAPEEVLKLANGEVIVQCVTLPYHKKMAKKDWIAAGGPEGHLKSQGLYIYRADRLIIAGGWLGLARQTELTKLCRVSVDIPNSMDSEWKIDVKKASAQLPPVVRRRLQNVVERFVGTSKRTYTRRGRKLVEEQRIPMWNRIQNDDQIVFRPNADHPVFAEFSERLDEDMRSDFFSCVALMGASLPIETLYADLMGDAEKVITDDASEADLRLHIEAMIPQLMEQGIPAESIPEILRNGDLARSNVDLVQQIISDVLEGN